MRLLFGHLEGCMYLKLCSLYKIVHNLTYFAPNIVVPKVTRLYTSTPFTLYLVIL